MPTAFPKAGLCREAEPVPDHPVWEPDGGKRAGPSGRPMESHERLSAGHLCMGNPIMPEPKERTLELTLVDLVVGLAILGLLLMLLILGVLWAWEVARGMRCAGRLKQVGVALQEYHAVYGMFPAGCVQARRKYPPEGLDQWAPWSVAILPYLGEQALYEKFAMDKRFVSRYRHRSSPGTNRSAQFTAAPACYQCPSNSRSKRGTVHTDYVGCAGGGDWEDAVWCAAGTRSPFFENGLLFMNSYIRTDQVTDGTSNTYLLGETRWMRTPEDEGVGENYPSWATGIDASPGGRFPSYQTMVAAVRPINAEFPQVTQSAYFMTIFNSAHPHGCYMGMVDGSVRFIDQDIDLQTHRGLGARNDGRPSAEFRP